MYGYITPERYKEYDDFVSSHPKGHLMQTRKWAAVKTAWDVGRRNSRTRRKNLRGSGGAFQKAALHALYDNVLLPRPGVRYPRLRAARAARRGQGACKKHRSYNKSGSGTVLSSEEKFADCLRAAGFSPAGDNKISRRAAKIRVSAERRGQDGREAFGVLRVQNAVQYTVGGAQGRRGEGMRKGRVPDLARLMKETGERDNFIVRGEKYFESF